MIDDPHITRPAIAELVSQLIIATARSHHHALPDPETAQFIINEAWSCTQGLRRSDEEAILDRVLGEMVTHLPWMNEGADRSVHGNGVHQETFLEPFQTDKAGSLE